jgi:hypothetical protein
MRFIILLTFCPFLTQAATPDSIASIGTIMIGGVEFHFKEIVSTASEFTKTFELYRGNKKILSHILFDEEADCDSEGLELGDFETGDSSITFYSYWAWVGGCCSLPYGARKQVYRIDNKGILHMSQSAIYLQNYTRAISAMKKDEAQLFIAKTAQEYNATFVLGKQADDLIAEVKQRFAVIIAKETKGWEHNRFGYMR